MGDTTHKSVQDANCMVARVIVLLVLCQARKIWWVLEQPVNSLLAQHMMFQELLRMREVDVLRLSTHMLWFGAPSAKPTWLYSSALFNLISKCSLSKICSKAIVVYHLFHPPLIRSPSAPKHSSFKRPHHHFKHQKHSFQNAKSKSRCEGCLGEWVGVWGAWVWVRGVFGLVFVWKPRFVSFILHTSTVIFKFILGRNEINELNQFADRSRVPTGSTEMAIRYKDSKGRDRIKGGSDLKKSQSYPRKFFGIYFVCIFSVLLIYKLFKGGTN